MLFSFPAILFVKSFVHISVNKTFPAEKVHWAFYIAIFKHVTESHVTFELMKKISKTPLALGQQ